MISKERLRVALVLFVVCVSAVACGDEEATLQFLALPGLLTEPGDSVDMTVQTNGVTQRFTNSDLAPSSNNALPHTRRFEVDDNGTAAIAVRLFRGGELAAEGNIDLELRSNFAWHVTMARSVTKPNLGCLNCTGEAKFPLSVGGDTLWLFWGGSEKGANY